MLIEHRVLHFVALSSTSLQEATLLVPKTDARL
jgi:hypothetical protein